MNSQRRCDIFFNIVKDTIAKVMAAADTTGAAGSVFVAGSLTLPVGTLVALPGSYEAGIQSPLLGYA